MIRNRKLVAVLAALGGGGLLAGILIAASPGASAAVFPWWHHHWREHRGFRGPGPSPSESTATPSPSPSSPAPSPTSVSTPTPTPSPTSTGTSSGTQPLPAALAGHPLVTSWTPQQIAAAPWNDPTNNPGNCPANPSAVSLNSSGLAELDTTGQTNNCTSVESPTTLPTAPGYVYEGDIYFSNFEDWPAFWMYGPDWPQDGEVDAVEANLGANYFTWHYGTNNTTDGTGSWNDMVIQPDSANISPGWVVVDIAFTSSGLSVYYNGSLYVSVTESVTTAGTDPMFLVVSEGSCDSEGNDVCASPSDIGVSGDVQIKDLKEFS